MRLFREKVYTEQEDIEAKELHGRFSRLGSKEDRHLSHYLPSKIGQDPLESETVSVVVAQIILSAQNTSDKKVVLDYSRLAFSKAVWQEA